MKVLLSPAKSLDLNTEFPAKSYTIPLLMEASSKVAKVLKSQSSNDLQKIMSISAKLSELNWTRHQNLTSDVGLDNARPCIYTFSGDVYKGLEASTIDPKYHQQLNQTIRILSGLYGVLKPFDLIQPYRLEMGTKLKIGEKNNLYEFWAEQVTEALNQEESELVINLASDEYAKVVNKTKLKPRVVTPVFKERRDGQLKVIGLLAKKARGLMARFIIEHDCQSIDALKAFNKNNYVFSENLSNNDELLFVST